MKKCMVLLSLLTCIALLASCAGASPSVSSGTSPEDEASPSVTVDVSPEGENTDDAAETGDVDADVTLSETAILSDKVSLLIPESFGIMSEELAVIKYPTEPRPSVIYTDDAGSINVAFNYTDSPAEDSDVTIYLDGVVESLTSAYPTAEWYRSGMETINGSEVGVMEFVTPAADTEIYNLMWLAAVDGQLLISTFNCMQEQMTDWQSVAGEILNSFRVLS